MEIVDKDKSRYKTQRAIHKGLLTRPDTCEVCKKTYENKSKIHAHHKDYRYPLDIMWLCSGCHSKEHRTFTIPKGVKFVSKTRSIMVPKHIHKKLKILAAEKRQTIKVVVDELVRQFEKQN